MEFKPTIRRSKKFWLAEIREIDAATQGISKKEVELMAQDLLKGMIDAYFEKDVEIKMRKDDKDQLVLTAPDEYAIPLILRRLRIANQITIEEITHACGFKSKNAYAQYEQGRRMPGIQQFSRLLEILGAQLRIDRIHEIK